MVVVVVVVVEVVVVEEEATRDASKASLQNNDRTMNPWAMNAEVLLEVLFLKVILFLGLYLAAACRISSQ